MRGLRIASAVVLAMVVFAVLSQVLEYGLVALIVIGLPWSVVVAIGIGAGASRPVLVLLAVAAAGMNVLLVRSAVRMRDRRRAEADARTTNGRPER